MYFSALFSLLFEKYFLSLHSFLLNAESPWVIRRGGTHTYKRRFLNALVLTA